MRVPLLRPLREAAVRRGGRSIAVIAATGVLLLGAVGCTEGDGGAEAESSEEPHEAVVEAERGPAPDCLGQDGLIHADDLHGVPACDGQTVDFYDTEVTLSLLGADEAGPDAVFADGGSAAGQPVVLIELTMLNHLLAPIATDGFSAENLGCAPDSPVACRRVDDPEHPVWDQLIRMEDVGEQTIPFVLDGDAEAVVLRYDMAPSYSPHADADLIREGTWRFELPAEPSEG